MHGIDIHDEANGIDAWIREVSRYHTSPDDYKAQATVPARPEQMPPSLQ